ncbi:MAG: type II toxin-antitoxin system VapC family toxin [Holophaga sp.]|nr:type II toxin-antitoxin system VapC family toxin [Holophaga sp.]
MTKLLYLDSCVIAKLFLLEDRSDEALALVNDPEVVSVLTSDLSFVEVCGVFSRAAAQGRITRRQSLALLARFREWFLASTTHIAVRLDQVTQAGATAIDLGLRGADALHLVAATSARDAAALVDQYVFVTYDVKLARAAKDAGVFTAVLG